MNIEYKTHTLGAIRQPSLRGTEVPPRARLQDIAAIALVIAFGALCNLRPGPVSPLATGATADGSNTAAAVLFKRN